MKPGEGKTKSLSQSGEGWCGDREFEGWQVTFSARVPATISHGHGFADEAFQLFPSQVILIDTKPTGLGNSRHVPANGCER